MTTAHRATFDAARGGSSKLETAYGAMSKQISVRDAAGHTTLKLRTEGQGTERELADRDFRAELEAREAEHARKRARERGQDPARLLAGTAGTLETEEGEEAMAVRRRRQHDKVARGGSNDTARVGRRRLLDSEPATNNSGSGGGSSASPPPPAAASAVVLSVAADPLDADDPYPYGSDGSERESAASVSGSATTGSSSESESESDGEEEEDTAALLAELEKVKRERAEAAALRQAEKARTEANQQRAEALTGNPLLRRTDGAAAAAAAAGGDFSVKRRWDDDVVFKNCARQGPQDKSSSQQGFINDTLRSAFQRKFLDKYIK
eukprot:UC1_evm3s1073